MTKFSDWINENQDKENIIPPGMSDEEAINFLKNYLLGEDWYIAYSCSKSQANTEIVVAILEKYSKQYKKEKKAIKA